MTVWTTTKNLWSSIPFQSKYFIIICFNLSFKCWQRSLFISNIPHLNSAIIRTRYEYIFYIVVEFDLRNPTIMTFVLRFVFSLWYSCPYIPKLNGSIFMTSQYQCFLDWINTGWHLIISEKNFFYQSLININNFNWVIIAANINFRRTSPFYRLYASITWNVLMSRDISSISLQSLHFTHFNLFLWGIL